MAYIGKTPTVGNFQKCDAISVVNGQAAYTLQVGGSNVSPESPNHVLVSLNGVLQAPTDSYTVSGATLTFASNLATGDVIDFVILLGNVLDLGVPSDTTVTTGKLVDNAVTSAKMFSGFANGITVADQWRVTSGFTGDANPISSNWERNDTTGAGFIGSAMTESSGVFTFPSTGIYRVDFHATMSLNSNSRYNLIAIMKTLDNSSYAEAATTYTHISNNTSSTTYASAHADTIIDVTNTSNVKVSFQVEHHDNNTTVTGGTDVDYTWAHFLRLGDT
tara:strand:- start:201 stop:1028 length:828 start_codon:yes stop_codon:yes gene_type:complete